MSKCCTSCLSEECECSKIVASIIEDSAIKNQEAFGYNESFESIESDEEQIFPCCRESIESECKCEKVEINIKENDDGVQALREFFEKIPEDFDLTTAEIKVVKAPEDAPVFINPFKKSALDTQIAGDHYQTAIQPIEYIHANNLGFIEGCVVKYISRFRSKNGKEDLLKIKHYVDLLIELEYADE